MVHVPFSPCNLQYLKDEQPAGWTEEDVRKVFSIGPAAAKQAADTSHSELGKALSREVLLYTRAEVNEEVIQSAAYGRVNWRVNYFVGAQYQTETGTDIHDGKVLHFLRVPHPSFDPDFHNESRWIEPLRVAMVKYYKPCTNKVGSLKQAGHKISKAQLDSLRFRRVDLRAVASKHKYYATNPEAITNKYVVAFVGGQHDAKELFCMHYAALTGNK